MTNNDKKVDSQNSFSIDDYESLPSHGFYVHLLAGGAAGILEHTVMFPFDSVKTRMQSLCPCPERKCKTPFGGLISMVKREGLFRPIRGISAVAGMAGPAHALYFTLYEKLKYFVTQGRPGSHPYAYGISGAVATMVHDAVMNPAEVIKQRLQMWGSPYNGCVQCASCVLKTEGLCAFYRSYFTQIFMSVPFQATHFIIYEMVQEKLNPKRHYDPISHGLAGAIAGGIAAAVTTPLDVCKTALNTQDWRRNGEFVKHFESETPFNAKSCTTIDRTTTTCTNTSNRLQAKFSTQHVVNDHQLSSASTTSVSTTTGGAIRSRHALAGVSTTRCMASSSPSCPIWWSYPNAQLHQQSPQCPASLNGLWDACKAVYASRGWRGFASGLQARIMYQIPSTTVSWTVYEFFKYVLSKTEEPSSSIHRTTSQSRLLLETDLQRKIQRLNDHNDDDQTQTDNDKQ